MRLINIYLFFLLSIDCYSFNHHVFNFNTIIRRSLDDSIINFIKINNINNMKIKNTPKYLILKYRNHIFPNGGIFIVERKVLTNENRRR